MKNNYNLTEKICQYCGVELPKKDFGEFVLYESECPYCGYLNRD